MLTSSIFVKGPHINTIYRSYDVLILLQIHVWGSDILSFLAPVRLWGELFYRDVFQEITISRSEESFR